MKNFQKKTKYDKQKAATYTAYMIGSSVFHICHCTNPYEVDRLYLHYTEMPRAKQYSLEDQFIRMTGKIGTGFRTSLSMMASDARFHREEDIYVVEFSTGGFPSFAFYIKKDGEAKMVPFAG